MRRGFNGWAAHLTTASPSTQRDAEQLVPGLDPDSLDAFAAIWSGGWHTDGRTDPLALRPDSVGDHLMRRHFGNHPDEFADLTDRVHRLAATQTSDTARRATPETALDVLITNVTWAETDNPDAETTTTSMWTSAISAHPEIWESLLSEAVRGSASAARGSKSPSR